MEFIWLAPSSNRVSDSRCFGIRVRIAESPRMLERILGNAFSGTLIIDVTHAQDKELAFSMLELWQRRLPIWILDPVATVASTVAWLKAGAVQVATTSDEIQQLMGSYEAFDEPVPRKTSMVGESRCLGVLEERIALVADRRCNVLIEGETGTGKEVTARAIHATGNRARGPWVAVNCGAIPENLLEAELFGHVKGAFTGAVQSRAGKFEAANHGTIFLDEIGDMPMAVQCKLLRVLQEREVERLGGNESIRLDVRVIAATNSCLADCVRRGSFRQDLFYRLNVFHLVVPPLRERMDDVRALACHFTAKICASERLPPKVLDPATLEKLMTHSWPGNIRELENAIEAAVISSGTRRTVFPSDICWADESGLRASFEETGTLDLPEAGIDFERVLQDFEKNILAQALARTRGNKTAAANLLGLKRTTLAARMRALESRMPRLVA